MVNGIVYDIEIVKGICNINEERLPDIEYCAGWNDHANMGISVIGVYDFVEDRFRVFCEDNLGEFFNLCAGRTNLISFNGVGFDNKVIRHVNHQHAPMFGLGDSFVMHYDLLREIWLCMGLNPDKFYWKTHGGVGLDAMCAANGLGGKTGNGALAPVQWQRGEIGSVIDYCLQDVKLTRDLFLLSQQRPLMSTRGNLNLRRVQGVS